MERINATQLLKPQIVGSAGRSSDGELLPFDVLFDLISDGSLPAPFSGDTTWSIVSGHAINTPTENTEGVSNGSLNAWTGSTPTNWSKQEAGGNLVTEETVIVHEGSAAKYTIVSSASLGRIFKTTANIVANLFAVTRYWAKADAVGPNSVFTGTAIGLNNHPVRPLSTTYQEFVANSLIASANPQIFPDSNSASGRIVYYDDISVKNLAMNTVFATIDFGVSNIIIKNLANIVQSAFAGVVVCLDSKTNPQNFIVAFATPTYAQLIKFVAGVPTTLISPTGITYAAGAAIEIRKSGSSVSMYYNGTIVGTAQTVSDAGIVNNTRHGWFSGYAGNTFDRWYCASQLTTLKVSWVGSSFTAANPGYSYPLNQIIRNENPQYDPSFNHVAVDGYNTYAMLVKLPADVLATSPNLIILDTVNDTAGTHCAKSLEAFIRLTWAANPLTRIILMRFTTFPDRSDNSTVNSPENSAALIEFDAIAAAYGITVVDWVEAIQELVNNQGHDLSEYVSVDTVHPTSDGYAVAEDILRPYVPNEGAVKPATLPSRLYDVNQYFEKTPTRKLGTAYDSRAGTWSNNGSEIISSTVGSTVTFSVVNAPAHSIGCYRQDNGTNDVLISLDGGAFTAMSFYQNGIEIPAGFTTAIIKVNAGTVKIGEFWAI